MLFSFNMYNGLWRDSRNTWIKCMLNFLLDLRTDYWTSGNPTANNTCIWLHLLELSKSTEEYKCFQGNRFVDTVFSLKLASIIISHKILKIKLKLDAMFTKVSPCTRYCHSCCNCFITTIGSNLFLCCNYCHHSCNAINRTCTDNISFFLRLLGCTIAEVSYLWFPGAMKSCHF